MALLASDPTKVDVKVNLSLVVTIFEPEIISPLPVSNTFEQIEATVGGILVRLSDYRP